LKLGLSLDLRLGLGLRLKLGLGLELRLELGAVHKRSQHKIAKKLPPPHVRIEFRIRVEVMVKVNV